MVSVALEVPERSGTRFFPVANARGTRHAFEIARTCCDDVAGGIRIGAGARG